MNQEEYDTRHILEDITRFELSMISGYVELLGAALDSAIRTVILFLSSSTESTLGRESLPSVVEYMFNGTILYCQD